MKIKRKVGAPRKAPGGLDKVLYVRATSDLLDRLDRIAEQERHAHPGRSVSRADIARELLHRATAERTAEPED